MSPLAALLVLLLERAVGYPQALFDRIGHPVSWIGWLIARAEAGLNDPAISETQRRVAGLIALGAILLAVGLAASTLVTLLRMLPLGWWLEIALASTLFAQKGLRDSVAAVARALREDGPAGARRALAHIVGRDTKEMAKDDIARAAIETLAENTADGIVAPLFYLVLFGLPGAALYKAVNTADSMIGHRSARYRAFGWGAAKLDDLANWVPARVTALVFAAAAYCVPGANPAAAWRVAQRDAKHHTSPNAGWPEAALAGALGFGLGGPRAYNGQRLDLPHMGEGRRALGARDIGTALTLYGRALQLVWAGLAFAALLAVF